MHKLKCDECQKIIGIMFDAKASIEAKIICEQCAISYCAVLEILGIQKETQIEIQATFDAENSRKDAQSYLDRSTVYANRIKVARSIGYDLVLVDGRWDFAPFDGDRVEHEKFLELLNG